MCRLSLYKEKTSIGKWKASPYMMFCHRKEKTSIRKKKNQHASSFAIERKNVNKKGKNHHVSRFAIERRK